MNLQDIAMHVAEEVGISTTLAKEAVRHTFEKIKAGIGSGEEIKIPDFGSFKHVDRDARTARNPKTGEDVDVPAKAVAVFKVAKALKDHVQEAHAKRLRRRG